MGPTGEERGGEAGRLRPSTTPDSQRRFCPRPPSRWLLATGQGQAGWPWVRERQSGRQALLGRKTPPPALLGDVSSGGAGKVTSCPLRPASRAGLRFMIRL